MHFPRGGEAIVILAIILAVIVVVIVGMTKVFQKAGKPGWACVIPIYNGIVMLQIIGKSPWLMLLMLIPIVNVIFFAYVYYKLAVAFGKPFWFCVLAILFGSLALCTMGFDDSEYIGPDGIYPEFLSDTPDITGVVHV
ncbi:MAG TPA: DUF5684 domain-containing protein [Candidatus Kapabacteria bacterium]|nr:DUF5684 domain-containing protein [Candidatus Kapabacteria bacterium]